MIASLAAVGLAPGLGSTTRSSTAPLVDDDFTPLAAETPTGVQTFEGPGKTIDATKPHTATIQTNQGDIEIELNTDAPETVNSFAFLAAAGFYDDLTFFYVDQDFVAQSGDPTCDSAGENTCTGLFACRGGDRARPREMGRGGAGNGHRTRGARQPVPNSV
jgi:hypothetical protein